MKQIIVVIATSIMIIGCSKNLKDYEYISDESERFLEESRWVDPTQMYASEWRDLDRIHYWDSLQQIEKLSHIFEGWNMNTREMLKVTLEDNGVPVPNISVSLQKNNATIWKAKTNNDGDALLFVNAFTVNNDTSYNLYIDNEFRQKINVASLPLELNFSFPKTENNDPATIQVGLMMDISGSMREELQYFQSHFQGVVERAESMLNTDIQAGFLFYKDGGDIEYSRFHNFDEESEGIHKILNQETAKGGGSDFESLQNGIRKILKLLYWEGDVSLKILFVVTDGQVESSYSANEKLSDSVLFAAANGVTIVPINFNSLNVEMNILSRYMSIFTNGTYIFNVNVSDDDIANVGSKTENQLYIDRLFVEELNTQELDALLVKTIVDLSK